MANIQSIITNGNGNVLIGTTTDNGSKLNVNGSYYGTGNITLITAGYPLIDLGVTTSNYFRINFDNPNDRLVIGKNGASSFILNASGSAVFSSTISATKGQFSDASGAGSVLEVYNTVATNATTAVIRQTTAGGNGNQDIGLLVDIQGAGDTDRIANFRYYDGSTYTSRMAILRGGNVGIGTSSPSSPFTVATDVRAASLNAADLRPQSQVNLLGGGGDSLFIGQLNNSSVYLQSSYFNATLATYPILLNPLGGNVLIGTTTDLGYKLFVNGSIVNQGNINSTGDPGLLIDTGQRLGFNESGVRSWTVKATGGNLAFNSGDGYGSFTFGASVTASSLIKSGGTSSQYLMADGSVSTIQTANVYTQTFFIPDTSGTAQWVKVGTWTAAQGGQVVTVEIAGHAGYNATTGQNQSVYIYMKTSNGSSVDPSGFAADSSFYTQGLNVAIGAGNVIWEANAAGVSATTYTLYVLFGQYTNGSQYTVTSRGGTWANVGTLTAPSGTTSSSTILLSEFRYSANNQLLTLDGNSSVLIGTTTNNGYKLAVNGTSLLIGNVYTTGEQGIELSWSGNTLNDNRIGRIRPISTPSQNPYAGGLAFDYYKYDGSTYTWFEGMRLNGAGNVGIGTTNPQGLLQIGANSLFDNSDASNAFNLKQTSTTAATGIYLERSGERKGYYIYVGGSVDSLTFQRNNSGTKADVMSLTRDGNVGIGTSAPVARLDAVAAEAGTYTTSTQQVVARLYNNPSDLGSGVNSAFLSLQTTTDGGNANPVARIGVVAEGYGSNNGAFVVTTREAAGNIEKMRITSAGNVGIGTSAPISKFHIYDNDGVTDFVIEDGSQGADGKRWVIQNYLGDLRIRTANDAYSSGANAIVINRTGTTVDSTIFENGNVGIGTTSPGAKLDVTGAADTEGLVSLQLRAGNSSDDFRSNQITFGYGGGEEYRHAIKTRHHSSDYVNAIDFYVWKYGTDASGAIGTQHVMTIIQGGQASAGNGRVGIGTTSPSVLLDVYNGSGWGGVDIDGTSGGEVRLQKNGTTYGNLYASDSGSTAFVINAVQVNDLILQTNSSERLRITSAGNVGINTTAPQQLLHVLGATNGYAMIQGASDSGQAGIYFKKEDTTGTMDRTKGLIVFHTNVGSGWGRGNLGFCLNSADSNTVVSVSDEKFRMVDNGDFLADGDVVAYSTTISDARYKTNIQPIESALDKVNQMRGVSFDWTAVRSGREFGVIAQEIEQIAPEVVSEKELLNGDTMKTVSYTSLVPFLIESIKELTQQVNELKAQLDGLTK
jgi:hypothetical protein